jgi:hypothetical protein
MSARSGIEGQTRLSSASHTNLQESAMTALKAAAVYFAGVFSIGFVLGTIRVLALVPALGPLAATLLELPLMLAASWFVAKWAIARFTVPPNLLPRLQMGGAAFFLLMSGETLLGLAFGRSLASQFSDLLQPAGLAGLIGQILFALIPALLLRANQKS